MRSTRLWFREGPPVKVYRYDSDHGQVASLRHEMSSCEPCYSWNVFHSHQAADRARFLEGMYSIFTGSLSRQTFTMCETRGGITGVTPCSLAIYMARLAFVDDQAEPGTLHLLRIAPLAWLRPERECRFENVPTEFGPVSVTARLGPQREELQLSYTSQFRHGSKRVVLHVPPVKGLTKITLNGKPAEVGWQAGHATAIAPGAGSRTGAWKSVSHRDLGLFHRTRHHGPLSFRVEVGPLLTGDRHRAHPALLGRGNEPSAGPRRSGQAKSIRLTIQDFDTPSSLLRWSSSRSRSLSF